MARQRRPPPTISTYDEKTDHFSLSPEQAMVFAEENSPAFFSGAFEVVQSHVARRAEDRQCFPDRQRASAGTNTAPACSAARSASSGRATTAICVSEWIPALNGVCRTSSKRGADRRGCRLRPWRLDHPDGARPIRNSTLLRLRLSSALDRASEREAAKEAGVDGRIDLRAGDRPRTSRHAGYDLVAMFDCLHDMGDPVGAGKACAQDSLGAMTGPG